MLRQRWLGVVAEGAATMAVGTSAMPAVPGAVGADLLLLERDGELHAVPGAAVTLTPRPALDGHAALAAVEWEPSATTLVVSGFEAEGFLTTLGDRAAMGTAAVLVGVADRLVAMAARYAQERSQFGKPIGSFQAVKHLLADALVRVEFARPFVYRAAWSLTEDDPDAGLHASMAKAMASDAATLAARTALQVHGAIGYTWEHDLHLWMKRAWALAAAWGDAAAHRARVLDICLGPGGLQAHITGAGAGELRPQPGAGRRWSRRRSRPARTRCRRPRLEHEQCHHGTAKRLARGLLPSERAQMGAEEVEFHHHGVIRTEQAADLVALVGEHRSRPGVVLLHLVRPVVDLAGADQLVAGMGEGGEGVVEAALVLRRHVLAHHRLPGGATRVEGAGRVTVGSAVTWASFAR